MTEVQHIEVRWQSASELLDPELRTSSPAAFIGDSWQRSTKRPMEDLRELLRQQLCVVGIATPVGQVDIFLGWAAVVPRENTVIHVYVKNAYRAQKDGTSEFRVGSSLLRLCGVDFARPVRCLTWSKSAARIAAKPGNPYRLVKDLPDSRWAEARQ